MATKTYSERRQAALFRAAREFYNIAADVLNDLQTPEEILGHTHDWARNVSLHTMDKGREFEARGHEETITSLVSENALYRARQRHSDAVTRVIRLRAEYSALANK